MSCKVCGQVLRRHRFLVTRGAVVEIVCWGCKVWAETGYVMPERRA